MLANFRANISEAQGDFLVFKVDAAGYYRLQITQPIFIWSANGRKDAAAAAAQHSKTLRRAEA